MKPIVPQIALRTAIPIYEQLVAHYRDRIRDGRLMPGTQVDSISAIQRRHAVSRETAKRVLHILEEEGWVVQRAGKGTFVADLRPKQKVWGVVVPFFSVQYEDLLLQLTHRALPLNREIRRFYDYNSWEEEVRLVRMMQRERYEAVVVIPTLDESRTWSAYANASPLDSPIVLFDHTMTYRDFHFVVQSYDLGVVRAMDYLLSHGEGGVAFVKNEGWTGRNMVLELMLETYRMVLRRRRPDVELVEFDRASHVDAETLRNKNVSGVICCDDISAIQVIGRLRDQGVEVPRDLRLVSYGNTDLARFFTPSISSVDPHNNEMADRLIDVLRVLDGLGGDRVDVLQPIQHVVQPELIVRET